VLKRTTVKGFWDIFLSPKAVLAMILPMTVICVVIGTAGASHGKTNDRSVDASGQSGEWQTVQMRVTAYCPCEKCCGKYSDGITACGHKIRPGDTFAAADKEYPFGTEMIIAGYNNGQPIKVLDRGGAIAGNRLDVFFHSHEEALKWGVRYISVKVRRK
jgi:3D (Asp-Asp-Asp) domain-containing protein